MSDVPTNPSELAQVQELVIALDANQARIEKQLAEFIAATQTELQAFLSGRVHQLAADNRALSKEEISGQCTALRLEVQTLIERGMAALLMKRQEVVSLAEIEHTLKRFASEAAGTVLRQFSVEHSSQLSALVRTELAAQPLQSTPGDPAAPLSPTTISLVSSFRGQWNAKLALKAGELFTFRGSVLLAKRDVPAGTVPNSQNQRGANPYFALFVPAGAPGPKGLDGLSTASLVSFPATSASAGVAGTFAYSAGFMAACVATNTWVFWPTSSDYPL